MAEAGFIHDERCQDALVMLEGKRLPDGGFPIERKIFTTTNEIITRGTFADWGVTGKRQSNAFVTADTQFVLKSAARLSA